MTEPQSLILYTKMITVVIKTNVNKHATAVGQPICIQAALYLFRLGYESTESGLRSNN